VTAQNAAPSQDSDDDQPKLPDADRRVVDNGQYRNLAQVPPRPVNLPTFLEAAQIEKTLIANRGKGADTPPPEDAQPDPAKRPTVQVTVRPDPNQVVARTEDQAPCLDHAVSSRPAATIKFEPGSSAITADELEVLAELMPTVREGNGAIRILGHGDTDTGSAVSTGRFQLAVARADAVAQALAGFGVPAPRLAVGVACVDTAMAGQSVQLYAES
jgi:outer membrane protein OmpA-like peptidoglycan-associated protein